MSSITRRGALRGLGAVAGASALGGCAGEDPGADGADIGERKCPDASSRAERLAPIDTFVVLMMENRSFDHCLGSLSLLEGRADVDGLRGDEWAPDLDGRPVPVFHQTDPTAGDIAHKWENCHAQWNGGAMDGWVREHQRDLAEKRKCGDVCGSPRDPMGYLTRAEQPTTYALADAYAVCDRWFSSVMGPTWPNRFYLHAATAKGHQGNTPILGAGLKTIWKLLDDHCLRGTNFYSDVPLATAMFQKAVGLGRMHPSQTGLTETFEEQARQGTLPHFSLIDPGFFDLGNDDHAPHDLRLGQALIQTVYNMLAASPQWSRTLFIVTYDEHGSFYDHVAPPTTVDEEPAFRQLGFRVPTLVMGPHVKRRYVSKVRYDHVSVIRTLSQRFSLPWLNDRVEATNDLSDCIDPAFVANPQPPVQLQSLDLSESELFDRLGRDGGGMGEVADAIARGDVPPEHDLRGEARAQLRHFLELGERYGAVRVGR